MSFAFKAVKAGSYIGIVFDANNSTDNFDEYTGFVIYDKTDNCFNGCIQNVSNNISANRTYPLNREEFIIYKASLQVVNYINNGGTLSLSSIGDELEQKIGYLKITSNDYTWYPSISWNLGRDVHTMKINNKEVLQIKRNSDNKILYQH